MISNYAAGLLDFHNHSTHSDGSDIPSELVARAKQAGVTALALTDHHAISGLEEFLSACRQQDILGIPFGTEICAELPTEILSPSDNDAPDLIILGKNPNPEPMQDYRARFFGDVRNRWLPETLKGLESIGFKIPPGTNLDEECRQQKIPPDILYTFIKYGDNLDVLASHAISVGHPELNGKSPEEAGKLVKSNPHRWLNRTVYAVGCPGYVKRVSGFNLQDAKNLANSMNCLLILAHPGGEYGFLSDPVISHYISQGVLGIEIRSYFNTPEQNQKFDSLASAHDLVRSGGSDCHGKNGPFKIGMHDRPQNQLPKQVLEELWDNLPA